MYQLIYISKATHPMSSRELNDMLIQAREKNKQLNITGMLVHHEGRFVQILEGHQHQVDSLFDTIKQDPRHSNVFLIESSEVRQRAFPGWEMAFRELFSTELDEHPDIKSLMDSARNHQGALNRMVKTFLSLIIKPV